MVHDAPPLAVAMMLGAEVPKSLTARHVAVFAHETAVRMPTPIGTVSEVQVVPASTVPMTTGLPKMPNPTAVHADFVAHEMPLRPSTLDGIA